METMVSNRYVEVRNGGYYVAGTRIGLDTIYYSAQRGRSAESTFEAFPLAGSLAKVRGAIAFIQEHPQEVCEYLKAQEARYEEFTQRNPLPPELIEPFENRSEAVEKRAEFSVPGGRRHRSRYPSRPAAQGARNRFREAAGTISNGMPDSEVFA